MIAAKVKRKMDTIVPQEEPRSDVPDKPTTLATIHKAVGKEQEKKENPPVKPGDIFEGWKAKRGPRRSKRNKRKKH